MIIKKSGGRWQLSLLASVVISAFFLNTAYAWQQEYIVDTQPGHSNGTTTSMYNEFGDSTTTLTDPLWHASVSSLGWRVDSRLGDLRPWAQISYNQQFGENIWKAQSGLSRMTATNQNGNWLDVTVGADMLLNQNIAAYAALSQAENTTNNSDYLYTMGVSARF